MSKQTAVEWLIKKLQNRQNGIFDGFPVSVDEIYDQAKEMEREQIEEAFKVGNLPTFLGRILSAKDYYNETYKGGSDE